MKYFSNWILNNEIVDLPLGGVKFTWSNGQAPPIISRLDRFLVSRMGREISVDYPKRVA